MLLAVVHVCKANATTSEIDFFLGWADRAYTPQTRVGAGRSLLREGPRRKVPVCRRCQRSRAPASVSQCLLTACVAQQGSCGSRITGDGHHFSCASIPCSYILTNLAFSVLGCSLLPSPVGRSGKGCLHPLLGPQGGHGGIRRNSGAGIATGVDLEPCFHSSPDVRRSVQQRRRGRRGQQQQGHCVLPGQLRREVRRKRLRKTHRRRRVLLRRWYLKRPPAALLWSAHGPVHHHR